MSASDMQARFSAWLEGALSAGVPAAVQGFCLNLAETQESYVVELVGCAQVDFERPDWPCSEDFRAAVPDLEVGYSEATGGWEQMLRLTYDWTAHFLSQESVGARRLAEAKAVAVGFVDGDLHYVTPAEHAERPEGAA